MPISSSCTANHEPTKCNFNYDSVNLLENTNSRFSNALRFRKLQCLKLEIVIRNELVLKHNVVQLTAAYGKCQRHKCRNCMVEQDEFGKQLHRTTKKEQKTFVSPKIALNSFMRVRCQLEHSHCEVRSRFHLFVTIPCDMGKDVAKLMQIRPFSVCMTSWAPKLD